METFATYPVFARLIDNPKLRYVVRPLLANYAGAQGLREYDGIVRDMKNAGKHEREAEHIAASMVAYDADQQLAGFNWRKLGQGALAVATGGASTVVKNRKKIADKLRKSAKVGWRSFQDSVKETLKSLKKINDINDVMNIVKMAVSGGLSIVGDAALDAINDMLAELLSDYIRKAAETIAKYYANGRDFVIRKVERLGRTETAKKVLRNVTRFAYDLLLGNPICVLEEGCVGPVSTALKKAGNPYVKLVGQILAIIYPIVQGKYSGYDTSVALHMYAGTKSRHGVDLIPKAKMPDNLEKTVGRVLDAIDSDYSMGIPVAYTRYKPWLIDMVARGWEGPRTIGAKHDPQHYFNHPEEAIAVLKLANKPFRLLAKIDRYIGYIERAWHYGQKAYDIYQALKDKDFTFNVSAWKAENAREYLNKQAGQAASYSKGLANSLKMHGSKFAKESFKDKLKDLQDVEKSATAAQDKIRDNIQQIDYSKFRGGFVSTSTAQKEAEERANKAFKEAEKAAIKKESEIRTQVLVSGKSITPRFVLKLADTDGLGAISMAQATLAEWQSAELGLMARAKWNEMAQRWIYASETTRKAWAANKPRTWRDEATDYKSWYWKMNTPEMKKLILSKEVFDAPIEQAVNTLNNAEKKKSPAASQIKEVIETRARTIVRKSPYEDYAKEHKKRLDEHETTSMTEITKIWQDAAREIRAINITVPPRTPPRMLAAQVAVEADKKSWTPTLFAAGAAVGAIGLAALTKR